MERLASESLNWLFYFKNYTDFIQRFQILAWKIWV